MVSPFEGSILGFLTVRPSSRYDVMKAMQNQSLYWAGSAGAVYAAMGRLVKKGLLKPVKTMGTQIYEVTEQGREALHRTTKQPVSARKLILDPALLRVRVRGLAHMLREERIEFYQNQLPEIAKAKELVEIRRTGNLGMPISGDLSDLAIAQLQLEEELLERLLAEELHLRPGDQVYSTNSE